MYLESDLHIAAYLLAKGFRFDGLELVGSRFSFKFGDCGDAAATGESAKREYRNGGLVPARDFAAAIQELKGYLYAAKNGNGRNYGNDYGR
jgi:hypothetical protein